MIHNGDPVEILHRRNRYRRLNHIIIAGQGGNGIEGHLRIMSIFLFQLLYLTNFFLGRFFLCLRRRRLPLEAFIQ